MADHERYVRFALVGIIAINALIYLPPYKDSFVSDDFKQFELVSNFSESPFEAYRILSPFWTGWHYRPVQNLLMLAGLGTFGLNPLPYYVTLLALHTVVIVLLYGVARKYKVSPFASLCVVVLFSLNAPHWQVLGWISSIGIVSAATFSLLAVYIYLSYLEHQGRWITLVAVIISCILALLSREESLVLPVLLLLIWLTHPKRRRPGRAEFTFFVILLSVWFVYLAFQFARPTWTRNPQTISFKGLADSLVNQAPSQFLLSLVSRYTLFNGSVLAQSGIGATIFAALFVILTGMWLWKSGRVVRVGFLWGVLYLEFLYLVVWVPLRGLADRYMYLPWIGISLAVGASLGQLLSISVLDTNLSRVLVMFGLATILSVHTIHIRQSQVKWLVETDTVKSIESQMMSLIPDPPSDAHFFAFRLVPQPDYVQAMAAVWYKRPFQWPGGHLNRLKNQGWATPDYYLLDYQEGVLYNLMPELQEHQKTFFVWSQEPTVEVWDEQGRPLNSPPAFYYAVDQVVGPPDERRLSIAMHPPEASGSWALLGYTVKVPVNSELRFAIMRDGGGLSSEDGMAFRIRVQGEPGQLDTVFETFLENPTPEASIGWTRAIVPMEVYWGQTVGLYLEVAAGANTWHDYGYWANPRLVVDTF